jgi:hypothetical protein
MPRRGKKDQDREEKRKMTIMFVLSDENENAMVLGKQI